MWELCCEETNHPNCKKCNDPDHMYSKECCEDYIGEGSKPVNWIKEHCCGKLEGDLHAKHCKNCDENSRSEECLEYSCKKFLTKYPNFNFKTLKTSIGDLYNELALKKRSRV